MNNPSYQGELNLLQLKIDKKKHEYILALKANVMLDCIKPIYIEIKKLEEEIDDRVKKAKSPGQFV